MENSFEEDREKIRNRRREKNSDGKDNEKRGVESMSMLLRMFRIHDNFLSWERKITMFC